MAENTAENNEETHEEEQQENGNFFIRHGKLAQAGGAYLIINTYYDDIDNWMESMSEDQSYYHTYEEIIINPAESNGERYLLLSVTVEVDKEEFVSQLEKNNAQIIDKMNIILAERTAEELTKFEIREKIKQEIGVMINKTVNQKAVRNLFFTKYVLQ